RITRIIGWRTAGRSVLRSEALETRRGFDQPAVDGEMLVAQQPQPSRMADHLVKEPLSDIVLEQATAVLGEHGGIETRLEQAHVQEPAVQQLIVQLLTERALAADRVQRNQQRRLEQSLGRNRWSATSGIHLIEDWRQFSQSAICIPL